MPNSLLTAVSGLLSHQRKLDVVANNLANMNTAGYKSSRIVFSDLMYEILSPATSGNGVTVGGTNPIQIGSGSKTAQITKKFSQGSFDATGQPLDFALAGEGFFVIHNGGETFYSRNGAFSLDDQGYLIDPSTGGHVQRFGSVGEPGFSNPAFQIPGDNRILIPLGETILGQASNEITFNGILNADAVGPLAEVLTSANPYLESGVPATTATLLNDLDSNDIDYQAGDQIQVNGNNADGSSFSVTLNVTPASTLGDLVAAVNGAITGATAQIDADGNLVLTAAETGESMIGLTITDDPANTGPTNFDNHVLVTTISGKDGDVFRGILEIFDVRGGGHDLQYEYQKTGDNLWNLTFSMDANDGEVVSAPIENIRFNDAGQLIDINGNSNPLVDLSINFNGIAAQQDMQVSLEGLLQIATEFEMSTDQNGTPPSTLISVRVNSDGMLEGISSSGQGVAIAQLAIALFRNPEGLSAVNDSYYQDSLNSGEVELGAATQGGRGAIRGGQLEGSNVDVAFEFTQLIVAQRGFSANARTITVADEMLEELTNIIR